MSKSRKTSFCNVCARGFKDQAALDDHMRDKHDVAASKDVKSTRRPRLGDIDPICIECGQTAQLVSGGIIYPHRRDLYAKSYYLCECGAYCGCHPNSALPLGYPCGPATRQARQNAHAAFDPLWKSETMSRRLAYAWLAEATGIEPDKCHIGMMSREQAVLVCKVVANWKAQQRSDAA